MVGQIETKYVAILIILFCMLTFIQLMEEIFAQDYVELTNANKGLVGEVLTYLSQIPIVGFLFNFFTINIPLAPDIVLVFVNLINIIVWVYCFICINNLIVYYFDLDEGLFGFLGLT